MAEVTPMMQQYLKTKEQYKDCILFYRLGDFYEMFFDDAKLVSKELELTLTGKSCGLEERAPMCGVPYHAVEGYLNRLGSRGYKVAICEQVEDPKEAKGLVARDVVRIVTPGTNLSTADETKNNYLMCIVYLSDRYGISTADITTGDYLVTEVDSERKLLDEINKFAPAEIVCNEAFSMSGVDLEDLKFRLNIAVYPLEAWYFDDELCRNTLLEHFGVADLSGLGLRDLSCGAIAAGALLKYLYETQKTTLSHLTHLQSYTIGKYMIIDSSSRRNLELTETLREKQKRGSLLWVLDRTKTAMGARTLRAMVEQPLIDRAEIEKRHEAIAELNAHVITREELREYLNPIYDLERLIGRISYQTANPRDLIAFRTSLEMLPHIHTLLEDFHSPLLSELREEMDVLSDLRELIAEAIREDPPISIRDGDIIRDGYHEDVDRYRKAKTEGKSWLAKLEAEEREKTGIKNLKIKYNKVFGYYLEVTNSYKDMVPDTWMRKQTLTNAERYITPELKELEDTILGAEDKLTSLEYGLFSERLPLRNFLILSGILCVVSYLMLSLSANPYVVCGGCALCGFSVGIMWPGTYSMAARHLSGGTAMFAMLALSGDLGCVLGPALAGFVADAAGGRLSVGILVGLIFPLFLAVGYFLPALRGEKKTVSDPDAIQKSAAE